MGQRGPQACSVSSRLQVFGSDPWMRPRQWPWREVSPMYLSARARTDLGEAPLAGTFLVRAATVSMWLSGRGDSGCSIITIPSISLLACFLPVRHFPLHSQPRLHSFVNAQTVTTNLLCLTSFDAITYQSTPFPLSSKRSSRQRRQPVWNMCQGAGLEPTAGDAGINPRVRSHLGAEGRFRELTD